MQIHRMTGAFLHFAPGLQPVGARSQTMTDASNLNAMQSCLGKTSARQKVMRRFKLHQVNLRRAGMLLRLREVLVSRETESPRGTPH